MKRIIWAVLILVAAGAALTNAKPLITAATTIFRICDSIGRQYACISSSMNNTYGFGGDGDTLATDSTVQRGCQMNVHRVKEANDPALSELLPAIISSQTQLDSSYLYSKWSSVVWALNNYYAPYGGLSGRATSWGPDSGRFSPRFAQVARANGIYLAPKTVFSCSLNMGSAVYAADSTVVYSDSGAIDSTRYGAASSTGGVSPVRGMTAIISGTSGTGVCSLKVFGSNQNLVHGRRWNVKVTGGSEWHFDPVVAADSLYNIDSVRMLSHTGNCAGTVLFRFREDRHDSL
jgi:hypothetical protein